MTLEQGTRFGFYEVTGKLGAGGMGEVYRATDTKLGRSVAIKTLPKAFADDADRLSRFGREARLLATLNHPHIASVYGLDEHEGTHYLAMELIEGETLEAKLKAGALAADDALRLALQIAEALEAAHGKGVIHRDLKPANIMVTNDGQVKVLDFGLAKAFSGSPGEASPMHSPALSNAMTQAGLALGTAGYMSPEQASRQGADQRADIWAFGVVLYEMLTGLPLFRGESVPHIIADVLKTEPDWSRLPPNLHPRIRHLLERCLTKKPRSRLHSIADARIEIEAVLSAPEGALPVARAAAAGGARPHTLRWVGGMAAVAVAAVLVGWFLRPLPSPEPGPVGRFSLLLRPDVSLSAAPVTMVAVSADGTRIAYAADNQIYLRNLDESEARPIPGTQMTGEYGATTPAFSPDGQSLVFVDAPSGSGPYTILRLPVSGGRPMRLHEGQGTPSFPHGISWPTSDTILFANAEGIVRMPANGGATELLVPRGEDERLYSPQLLPGGVAVLFTRVPGPAGTGGGYNAAEIVVQLIGDDDRTVLRPGGTDARYLPTGHLVFAEGTTLFAVPFDSATRSLRGGPVPLVDGLQRSSNGFSDTAHYAVSASGTLVFAPGDRRNDSVNRIQTTLSWIDREGREVPLPVRPDDYTMARISPDGTKVALVVSAPIGREQPMATWIYDVETANLRLLMTEPSVHDGPVWSADSRRLYFRSPGVNAYDIYVTEIETGDVSLVANGSVDGFPFPMPWSLSPSEDTLTIINAQSEQDVDFATVSLPTGELTRALAGEGVQSEPSFAPNGAWIAYHEQRPGGAIEINVRPYPGLTRTLIPVGPGSSPVFSRDGSELYFFDAGWIAAIDVAYEPSLRFGAPRRLFETDGYMSSLYGRPWDPDPSGTRFLIIHEPAPTDAVTLADSERPRIEIVLNWFAELASRVPTE